MSIKSLILFYFQSIPCLTVGIIVGIIYRIDKNGYYESITFNHYNESSLIIGILIFWIIEELPSSEMISFEFVEKY